MFRSQNFVQLMVLFVAFFAFGSVASAEVQVDFSVFVADYDVTLESQIMIMAGVPIMLDGGMEKRVALPPGDYMVIAMWEHDEIPVMPIQEKLVVSPGDEQHVELRLQSMASFEQMFGMFGDPQPNGAQNMQKVMEQEEPPFKPEETSREELEEMLAGSVQTERRQAFDELYRRDGMDYLGHMLRHGSNELREWALDQVSAGLGEMGDGRTSVLVPQVVLLLHDVSTSVRVKAARIVSTARPYPVKAVPYLIMGLEAEEPTVRRGFVEALGAAGANAAGAVASVALRLSTDEDGEVRRAAANALGRIGVSGGFAFEVLQEALQDPVLEVRREVANVFASFGDGLEGAVPALLTALEDRDALVRSRILLGLAKLPNSALAQVVRPVVEVLEDTDRTVRLRAVHVLAAAGPEAIAAVPALIRRLSDERSDVVVTACQALIAIGPVYAIPAIGDLVDLLLLEMTPGQRDMAWSAAATISAIGAPAIPTMLGLLYEDSPEAKARAATVLGRIGSDAASTVPRLTELYRDESEHDVVRRDAFNAIRQITGEEPVL